MRVGPRVNQLSTYSHPIAHPLHTSFDHVGDAERVRDLT